jgi:uncharacterized protein YjdB
VPTISVTSASGGAKTYSSSDPSVATIDPTTGVISLVAAGTVSFTILQVGSFGFFPDNTTYYERQTHTTPTLTVLP